jgi:soluble lytic murein transglycosylase-like protein
MSLDRALIEKIALTVGLPVDHLAAQVLVESSGDPNAFRYEHAFFVSYIKDNPAAKGYRFGPLAACSYGLLQILYETALEIGFIGRPEYLFDPEVGLTAGAKHMKKTWDWAGGTLADYPRALSAYNGGQGLARKAPPFANQSYIDKVYALIA